jgi:hypothetical protein
MRDESPATSSTSGELGDWGEEYLRALEVAAAHAGIAPLDLHRQITRGIASTQASPDCLTLAELEACLADTLASERRAHAFSCSFCVELLQVVATGHPEHQAAFIANAAAGPRAVDSNSTLVAGIGLAMTGIGLAGVAYRYLRGRSSESESSERK